MEIVFSNRAFEIGITVLIRSNLVRESLARVSIKENLLNNYYKQKYILHIKIIASSLWRFQVQACKNHIFIILYIFNSCNTSILIYNQFFLFQTYQLFPLQSKIVRQYNYYYFNDIMCEYMRIKMLRVSCSLTRLLPLTWSSSDCE